MINHLYDLLLTTDKYLRYLEGKIAFNENGYPQFTRDMFLKEEPDLIVPYYNRHNKLVVNPQKTVLCFFCSDDSLYSRFERVLDELDEYRQYQGVIGLDITVTNNMDTEWQNMLMLLNQLFLAVLACNGIKIVMNARIGSPGNIQNLRYIPKNVMWATGFLGCDRLNTNDDLSFIRKVLFLMPSKLLIYGKHDRIAEQQLNLMGISHHVYPDYHRISKGVA